MSPLPPSPVLSVATGARLFAVLAMGAPVLFYRDDQDLISLVALGLVWVGATLLDHTAARRWSVLAEAALVGAVSGAALDSTTGLLLALAVPPFVAGLRHGRLGVVAASGVQLAAVLLSASATVGPLESDQGFGVFTWSIAGLGLGLIGDHVRSNLARSPDPVGPYRDAQRLIKQLIDISDDLSSGLDVHSLGGAVISGVRDRLPTEGLALYMPQGEALVPLLAPVGSDSVDFEPIQTLALESWARTTPLVDADRFAFPLGQAVVVAGALSTAVDLQHDEIELSIRQLRGELAPTAVQLDTALMFAAFRDNATADLRRRLAREMHDGIAQDIASLGYLVDALAARPASPQQAEQLAVLRDRITSVVAEVRQSVLTLRTSVGEAESLGAAIGNIARHLSESSRVPIRVTVDEHSTRLRPEVEAELFRITQEAMNNAIKHAEATHIHVHCQVHAPDVAITVTDDGRGLQPARSDSHGLKIMRERARLVGADLTIGPARDGGLVVSAVIDTTRPGPTYSRNVNAGRV